MWGYILSLERNVVIAFSFGEPRADYYFGESTFGSATQGNERMWNNSLNDVNTVVSNLEIYMR